MKQNEKIGKFCVLIVAALLVTSVAVAVAVAQPAPYPGAGPTPTPTPTPAPGAGGPAPYPTPGPSPTPPGAMPDLVVEDKWETFADGEVTVHFTVANIGDAQARSSTACKYIDGIEVDTVSVPALGAGTSCTRAFDPEPCPPGETITVTVCADNYDVVAESDETNNCMTNTFTCPEGPEPGGPDLVVDKDVEVVVCADPALQCCYNVEATVTNIGNEVARTSDACIYINGVHDPADDEVTERLGPGASDVVNFGPFECLCSDDLINVTVCADNYNVVAESNENNNCETNFVDNRVGGIEVTKEVWDPVTGTWEDERDAEHGDIVEFRCTVHNSGCCCDLTDIVITDVLSDSLEYVNAVPAPDEEDYIAGGATTLTWVEADPLEPCNELVYFIFARVVGPCGVDTNTQTATATTCTGEGVMDSDTATINTPQQARIEVIKEVWDPVTNDWVDDITVPSGTRVHFRSIVHNSGTCCDLTNIEVWDELSNSLRNINARGPQPPFGPQIPIRYAGPGGSTILYWSIPGPLEPCEELEFHIWADVVGPAGAVDTNTQRARAYSAETDELVSGGDRATVRIPVPPPPPVARISVTKTANPDEGEPCTDVDFTITVTNTGDLPLNPVTVVDRLPAGMTYVRDNHGGAVAGQVITWGLGDMVPGEVITILLTAHIDDVPAGPLVNLVGVRGTPPLGADVRDDDTAVVTRRTARIDVTKTADPVCGPVSTNVDFTITVTNNGNIALDPVIVVDTLEGGWRLFTGSWGLSYVLDDSGGVEDPARTITWNLGAMAVGEVRIIHLVAHIDGTFSAPFDNDVYVGGTSPAGVYVDDVDTATVGIC